ncbi:FAD-dependent oxidoreductase [Streptomyces sp. NPDC005899]|uniref:NAD(P)/FAD-dependent oxidoreductase n=1 Tax=Streptomyces sp. NPDC005899 TaxID=3155716 RepID=UPI0033D3FC8E
MTGHGRRRLVVVGASLAGLRAAQTLRAEGFEGELTVVGAELHAPYDRPPLSKQALTAAGGPPDTALPVPDGIRARWLLGRPAVALDPRAATVALADGTTLPYDGLLVATGAAARRLPPDRGTPPRRVFTLRDRDDAHGLRAELTPGRRLLVVGAGFLGSEVAAAGRALGLDVTVVEAGHLPLERAAGRAVGAFVADLHRTAGVDLRVDTTVETLLSGPDGALTGAVLGDGTTVTADVAVLALGAVPATHWLAGSGLDAEGGVLCDRWLRALDTEGRIVPGVYAAGDAARVPQPLADGRPLALGHWNDALDQAATAARTMLTPHSPHALDAVPSFWSDLYGARIRSVGLPAAADEARVVEHDAAARRMEVSYHRAGRLVGALTIGRTARLAAYREELHRRSTPVPAG